MPRRPHRELILLGAQRVPRRGLVADWRFGNWENANYLDSQKLRDWSGNGHTLQRGSGTGSDSADWTIEAYDGAFATSTYGVSALLPTAQGSLVSLFSCSSFGNTPVLIGADSGTGSNKCFICVSTAGHLAAAIGSQSFSTIVGTSTMSLNAVHLGIVTWDGANVALYVDGKREYIAAQASTPVQATKVFYAGVLNGSSLSEFTNGKKYQDLIYTVALTPTEVSQLYLALRTFWARNGSGVNL